MLDEVQEVVTKYQPSHQMVVCGDWKASILNRSLSRDTVFSNFCTLHRLKVLPGMGNNYTYTRNGHSSQIGYIILTTDMDQQEQVSTSVLTLRTTC